MKTINQIINSLNLSVQAVRVLRAVYQLDPAPDPLLEHLIIKSTRTAATELGVSRQTIADHLLDAQSAIQQSSIFKSLKEHLNKKTWFGIETCQSAFEEVGIATSLVETASILALLSNLGGDDVHHNAVCLSGKKRVVTVSKGWKNKAVHPKTVMWIHKGLFEQEDLENVWSKVCQFPSKSFVKRTDQLPLNLLGNIPLLLIEGMIKHSPSTHVRWWAEKEGETEHLYYTTAQAAHRCNRIWMTLAQMEGVPVYISDVVDRLQRKQKRSSEKTIRDMEYSPYITRWIISEFGIGDGLVYIKLANVSQWCGFRKRKISDDENIIRQYLSESEGKPVTLLDVINALGIKRTEDERRYLRTAECLSGKLGFVAVRGNRPNMTYYHIFHAPPPKPCLDIHHVWINGFCGVCNNPKIKESKP